MINPGIYDHLDPQETLHLETPVTIDTNLSWRRKAVCAREYATAEKPNGDRYSWCGERAKSRHDERRICWEECPVRRECLTWAIATRSLSTRCIYGGYRHDERAKIWQRWNREGIIPHVDKMRIDPDAVYRLFAEAANSPLIDLPNTLEVEQDWSQWGESLGDDDDWEPDEADLRAIEAEGDPDDSP